MHEQRKEKHCLRLSRPGMRKVFTQTYLAKEFVLARQTISKWVNSETLPPDTRGRFKQKCLIDDYVPYLRQRIESGICQVPITAMAGNLQQGFGGQKNIGCAVGTAKLPHPKPGNEDFTSSQIR